MMQIEQLNVKGTSAQGVMLCAPGGEGHPNMIVVPCKAGYLMCGYLNIDAAEKFGDAAVLVGGADFKAVLENPIKGMTTAAKEAGVKEGMTGAEAAAVLNK
ncbi:MAG: DUF1805 domain-containing protein [Eubacterium sp.]|jgi:uncharacterized protein YunC (DUF1805 family)|nr:DUF1805 domain-containing protein [Eubacterium sp.]MCH4045935.1 DUF1805 domain-containing protein [Eubacterium sp.]MCH4079029.1 DUF1805 domain-containing protein [Eubacterium sp.]MCI1457135.1 DUF1805 domain-containing protein [Eubacterium sp.]MCI1476475.1 DUF1805 domain-containing protein [Eubacterium sp.]